MFTSNMSILNFILTIWMEYSLYSSRESEPQEMNFFQRLGVVAGIAAMFNPSGLPGITIAGGLGLAAASIYSLYIWLFRPEMVSE